MVGPTKSVGDMMDEWAREATHEAFRMFQIKLTYSEESIEDLERVLGALHIMIRDGYQTPGMPERPSKDDVWLWSTRYGAYLGKLMVQYVGGKWEARRHAQVGFGYVIPVAETSFFPIVKANDRLLRGESENVVEYYVRVKNLVS